MDELEKIAPNSSYSRDMLYHRARVYFNLGYFDDSLLLFRRYIDAVSIFETNLDEFADKIAAAYFWMGECLYIMGQFDEAHKYYTWVIDRYPKSPRYEISVYRVELIKQKKIEAELLALLQWSHEESLRTNEDYQRRIRIYEYTLNEYQRRIAEITSGQSGIVVPQIILPEINPDDDPEASYRRLLEWARQLIMVLDQMIIDREYGGYD
jgi:tetratricopeptide (TPR) repeat protein